MSEPEIARRCPTCGASIREVAHFCPQCGKELPPAKAAPAETPAAAELPETTSKDTSPLEASDVKSQQKSMSDTVVIERPAKEPEASTPSPSLSDTVAIERPAAKPKSAAGPRVRGAVGAKVQQATTLARGVEGDVKNRVRQVRKISGVVIDEAGYDPSLRFVLVAAVLFVLFLVIVLLNKFIT
jgi:zinc-ribbon domain